MSAGGAGDKARATVHVAATPQVAFDLFTREIDAWWRRGIKFRASGREAGVLCFEGGVGGRLFETFTVDGQEQLVVVGTITAWEPPARFVFDWRNRNFAPHEKTEVEVRFEAAGEGTRVTVEHRGWSAIRPIIRRATAKRRARSSRRWACGGASCSALCVATRPA